MAESNPSPEENQVDSKVVSAAKSFAIVASAIAIPAGLAAASVSEDDWINKLFYAVWTLAAGYAACVIVDAKVVPKIGLLKTIGVAGIFTGLAAAGLLTWQLNAGDAEKPPVAQPTKAPASMTLPQPAK